MGHSPQNGNDTNILTLYQKLDLCISKWLLIALGYISYFKTM